MRQTGTTVKNKSLTILIKCERTVGCDTTEDNRQVDYYTDMFKHHRLNMNITIKDINITNQLVQYQGPTQYSWLWVYIQYAIIMQCQYTRVRLIYWFSYYATIELSLKNRHQPRSVNHIWFDMYHELQLMTCSWWNRSKTMGLNNVLSQT